jgi:hypothetical protein
MAGGYEGDPQIFAAGDMQFLLFYGLIALLP